MKSQLMILTKRDLELLIALAQRVRLFSLRQIADHWWHSEIPNARRRLKKLEDAGLVTKFHITARKLPTFFKCIHLWYPGDSTPNFGSISYQLKSRWKKRPAQLKIAYAATEKARKLLGGKAKAGLKTGTQATHDLGVAAIWIVFHAEGSTWADMWRGEDLMAHTRVGQKLPDAFIINDHQETISVIEFGGAYSSERVKAFHDDCEARNLPYQIW